MHHVVIRYSIFGWIPKRNAPDHRANEANDEMNKSTNKGKYFDVLSANETGDNAVSDIKAPLLKMCTISCATTTTLILYIVA